MELKKTKVVVAGGGTAGWIAATALARQFREVLEIVLVESEDIGTVGVGEATIPPMRVFHQRLRIDEQSFMKATQATFKLGIQFEGWNKKGDEYIHSFGRTGKETWMAEFLHFWQRGRELGISGEFGEYCLEWQAARKKKFGLHSDININYAYHLDASRYARFLRGMAEEAGVRRVEGRIAQVRQHDDGCIRSLMMESGEEIEGDLFIDCTGFRGLLIEQTLHTGYEDWSHWLPCDTAVAVQTAANEPPVPYTRSIAHSSGWRWRIPLQTRVGNGSVFCSRYRSEDEAVAKLLDAVEGERITDPRIIRFRTGRRRRSWNKNVVALGLASGFVEPLESTSIHLVQSGIAKLMSLFPNRNFDQEDIDEYNRQVDFEYIRIRDFLIAHYHITQRDDSAFWNQCRTMSIPDTLRQKMEHYKKNGRIFRTNEELFNETSWLEVMHGQGIRPRSYHPIVDVMPKDELLRRMDNIKSVIERSVDVMPPHAEFIAEHCKAETKIF